MMTSSANSMETVVFSQFGSGGADWEQWELDDTGRAEIPLKDGEDTHVAGMGLSLCSTCDVQIGEWERCREKVCRRVSLPLQTTTLPFLPLPFSSSTRLPASSALSGWSTETSRLRL